MSETMTLARYGDLALAAYARQVAGVSLTNALRDAGFSIPGAERFASNWAVIASYEHTSEPYPYYDPDTGVLVGTMTRQNGFAATVFQDQSTGERVLAIRGTHDAYDYATDVISVAVLGSPEKQGQYQSLRSVVSDWKRDHVLPERFAVAGHSLGGFLANALALEFPQTVTHSYVYNAPGLGGLTGRNVLDAIANVYHITGGAYDPSQFTNVRAKPGNSMISGLGSQPAPPILIEGEDHGLIANHSIVPLTDSLALYDAFGELSATDAIPEISAILRGTRATANGRLETALDALRDTVLGVNQPQTTVENRDAYYANLLALRESGPYRTLAGQARLDPVASLSNGTLVREAGTSLGSLVALQLLAPFRLSNVDAQLVSRHAALDLGLQHDLALSGDDRATDAWFSARWREERARFLGALTGQAHAGVGPALAFRSTVGRSYEDRGTGVFSGTDFFERPDSVRTDVTFGRLDAANTLTAGNARAILFGGQLDDTLTGSTGRDYLEGNRGNDTLVGSGGRDTLIGGEGADQIDGGTDVDILLGGSGVDTLIGGTHDDRLDGGRDNDILRGDTGIDTYVIRAGYGTDTITDSDGRGQIEHVDSQGRSTVVAGVGLADRTTANRWAMFVRGGTEFTATRNSPLTLTAPDGSQVVVSDHANGQLGITLLADIPDQATTHTITGDQNADRRDTLLGTGVNDLIDGGEDTDRLFGGIGADRLLGGAGRDRLEGEDGEDILEGGDGADILEGGAGRDRLFAGSTATLDPLIAVRTALGSTAPATGQLGDWLSGGDAEDVLIGAEGDDGLAGGSGMDFIVGGAGDDSLLGDAEFTAATGGWGWVDQDSGGLLTRSFTGMDSGALDPLGGANDTLLGGAGDDFALGGRGDDAIHGDDGADFLQGDAGSDAITGGEGDDRLVGDGSQTTSGADNGHDWLSGDAGADMLIGGGDIDDLLGGEGNDTIFGDDAIARLATLFHGDDRIDAGAGDDAIEGGYGADSIDGGDGDDRIAGDIAGDAGGDDDWIDAGSGDDLVEAGGGDDHVEGGDGDDSIDGMAGDDEILGGAGRDLLAGSEGDDSLEGADGSDSLWGGLGIDGLDGGDGDDALHGGDGNDLLMGATGQDALHGDAGDDDLVGEDGTDYLDGGTGDDSLNGGLGSDALAGGEGNDTLDGDEGSDILLGGAGSDRFLIGTGDGVDFLADLDASDVIVLPTGLTAEDLDFQQARDEHGRDAHLAILAGNAVIAVALEAATGTRPTLQLASGSIVSNTIVDDALARHPSLQVQIRLPAYSAEGSALADRIVSAGGRMVAHAAAGNDTLLGGRAADELHGGEGADQITAAAGDDVLGGDAGDDQLDGGDGNDVLDGGDGDDVLTGAAGNDRATGGTGNDTITGGAGADDLAGGEGDDALDGGDGRDTLAGDAGADTLLGGAGNDALDGGAGDDTLTGDAGNDTLAGGAGDDTLDGGTGDDTYVVDGLGLDRIRDADGVSAVRFAAGVLPTSFSLTRGAAGGPDEHSLIVDFGGGNRTIIEDGLRAGPASYTFSDGTTLTRAQLLDRRFDAPLVLSADATRRQIAGGSGVDAISAGTASHADLRGGGGRDTITGGAGSDRLAGDDGDDTLTGLAGADLIDGGAGDDTIDAGDGDDLVSGGAGADTLTAGAGNDLVLGGDGNDVYASDGGDDVLHDSSGDDVYRFGTGAGYDQIVDSDGANRVRLASGIAIADVSFRTDGTHLVAALADGSRLRLAYAVAPTAEYPSARIDGFDSDSGSITLAEAIARATPMIAGDSPAAALPSIGTSGSDRLSGTLAVGLDGNDTIVGATRAIGGPGDDSFENGRTFVFGRGDGHDTVQLFNSASRKSVGTLQSWIEMGPGVVTTDVALGVDGRDLLVTIRDSGDSVRVRDHFSRYGNFPAFYYPSAIAGVRFADGSTLDFNAILDGIGVGTDGDDHLGSASVIWDTIRAGDGNDVVVLHETPADVFGGDGDDVLSADPYLPGDMSRLHGEGGNDRLTAGSANSARTELYGDEGDDRLIGHPGSLLDGGTGDDRYELFGGATGGPVGVAFGRGQGRDSITYGSEFQSNTTNPRFDIRVSQPSYRDLVVERDGEDLVLSIRDRDDRIAVPDFFSEGSNNGGMVNLDVVDPATGVVFGDSPTAAQIAARAVAVSAGALSRVGTDAAELMVGAGGADTLSGGAGDDELDGMSGDDRLDGGGGADTLTGRSGHDILDGGSGDDRLSGGRGDDVLRGGEGDDRIVDWFGDNVAEGGSGNDSIRLEGTHGFALGGDGADNLSAAIGDHLLAGEAGDDNLSGSGVRVEFDGGAGDDRISVVAVTQAVVHFGRDAGRDSVHLPAFAPDTLDEIRMGPGVVAADLRAARSGSTLTLSIVGGTDALVVSNALAGDAIAIGRVTFADGSSIDGPALLALARAGTDGPDELLGSTGDDLLAGGAGDDTLDGHGGNDTLDGGSGADTLDGGSGNDTLDGGSGADAMRGGTGDDIYFVDDALDTVAENPGEGTDELCSSLTAYLPTNIERLRLVGTANVDAWGTYGDDDIAGNAGDNYLYGNTGADRLAGGAGNDTYHVDQPGDVVVELADEGVDTVQAAFTITLGANVENLVLATSALADGTGNALDNTITGGGGANVLTGLAGNDTLDGSLGADRLVGGTGDDTYVVDNAGDVVVELAAEGDDTVRSSIAYVLPSDVENLVLLGGGSVAATGNALANRITGSSGANVIDGRGGADTMTGGRGNDTYVVDAGGDTIVELAAEGTDAVQSSVSFVLSANVETLTLTGASAIDATGNTLANTLTGNTAANTVDGGGGNDTMRGGAGDDTYVVDAAGDIVTENASEGTDTVRSGVTTTLGANVERLVLTGTALINGTGNTLANSLTGNGAANVLNGGAGADTLMGGGGNDTYVVDAAGDVIVEIAGGGTDLVQSSIGWTLASEVENLTLTGAAAINGTGNALANVLTGNAAANTLNGGTGNDTMRGGAGNDIYVVDAAGDVVAENAGEGTDLVQASLGWTLSTHVENLTLTGTAAINGTGNTLANALTGNAAANTLNGGTGADAMTGGAGDDTYVVDNAADTTIESASAGLDRVQASLGWTLAVNVEDLTLTGTAAINGTGNTLANELVGNAAVNTLAGLDGNDLVFGAAGDDTLSGGNGNDLLQGGDGNDAVSDAAGNNLLDGGLGIDTLTGSIGREILIGGKGDDTIDAGSGVDLVAFNRGDGRDTLLATAGTDDTLSLGGGLRYADLGLRKIGNDLVLDAGTDQITFKDWYAAAANHRISTLQMVVDASTDYSAVSTDPLRNRRVAQFDFARIAGDFDAALAANPALGRWTLGGALTGAWRGGSDTSALGGDLAYQYGRSGTLSSIGDAAAGSLLGDAAFAVSAQALMSAGALSAGSHRLR